MSSLAITGSTGRLGGRVAARLAATAATAAGTGTGTGTGTDLRLIVRDPSRAPDLPGAQVAVTSRYSAREESRAALEGVDTLFMVSAAEQPDRVSEHLAFVEAAVAAGVRHVVYTSFYGAAPDAVFTLGRDHWATEEAIRASGMEFTFLRDNLYADFFPFMVGEDGVIRGPAGDGRLSAVATDDIADVAAAVLTDPSAHAGATYAMTGPQALTFHEIASIVTAGTGRAVTYHPETVEEAYASRATYGAPDWQVDAWVSTYTAVAAGEMDGVSDDIQRLSGHPATSLAELLART